MLSVDLTPRRPEVLPFDFLAKTSLNFPKEGMVWPLNQGWKMSAKGRARALCSPPDLNCGPQGSGLGLGQKGGSWALELSTARPPHPRPSPLLPEYGSHESFLSAYYVPGSVLSQRRW